MQRKTEHMLMYRIFFQHSNSQNSYLLSSETVYSQIFHIVLLGHLRPSTSFPPPTPRTKPDSRNQTDQEPVAKPAKPMLPAQIGQLAKGAATQLQGCQHDLGCLFGCNKWVAYDFGTLRKAGFRRYQRFLVATLSQKTSSFEG